MADLGSGIKQVAEETAEVVKEVTEEVKDSLGQALEQGAQSATGTQLTPQQIQQKQADDQKKIAEARRKIAFYQQTDQAQKMVRQQNKQKEMQRIQVQQQEKQVIEIKKKKRKNNQLIRQLRMPER